ncbi:hypothetical protein NL676_031746 [Syzygium grande]|nr:hypothetical protein NL676_031746 [Syzygium grande]
MSPPLLEQSRSLTGLIPNALFSYACTFLVGPTRTMIGVLGPVHLEGLLVYLGLTPRPASAQFSARESGKRGNGKGGLSQRFSNSIP